MNEPNPLLDTLRSHVRDLEVRIAEAERDTQNRGNVLAAAIAAADKARDDAIAAARSARNEAVAKARAASPAMNLTALRRQRARRERTAPGAHRAHRPTTDGDPT